ncbi:MAG: tol-pal system protein YbgF [Pseudomonadota bacterium]
MIRYIFQSLLYPLRRPTFLFVSVSLIFFLNGCASNKDVVRLQYDLHNLNSQITALKKDIEKFTKQSSDLLKNNEEKIQGIEQRIVEIEANIKESINPVRKNQAETGARIDNLQIELRSLGGKLEEYGYLLDEQNKGDKAYESKLLTIEAKLSAFEKRLLFLESFFGSNDKPSAEETPPKEDTSSQSEGKETTEVQKPDSKELYEKAYDYFKKGDIDTARVEFRKYLKVFPDTEYSDNAQYWIAESFFIEKKYKQSILEFEEVLRKYPKGNKAPTALLKQGLAFYKLGDNNSAKLLFQKVIKDHPDSNEAKLAKKELEGLD